MNRKNLKKNDWAIETQAQRKVPARTKRGAKTG